MNKNYQRGVELERSIKRYLESLGIPCLRTAGSKGSFDLIALGKYMTYLLQIKLTSQANVRASPKLVKQLERYVSPHRGVAILIVQKKTRASNLCILRRETKYNKGHEYYEDHFDDIMNRLVYFITNIH